MLLDGTASSDPDGDPLTYRWSIASRPQGSTAALTGETTAGPSLVVDTAGTYVVQLIVNDGSADSAPDTMAITTSNAVPVAHAGPDQADAPVGALVTLDGSGSQDADGHPLTFEWVLLTRPAGSAASLGGSTTPFPTFTPDAAGDYVAQLIVNDGFADSAPDTVLVRAVAPEPVVVTVEATDASASESGDGGLVTVSRTGDTASAVTVNYQVVGTATNGVDFDTLAASVTIPAGAAAAAIAVTPIDDDLIEQAERVEVLLAGGAGYTVGSPALAIVTIADNDLPVVTVSATDATASEAGPATGTFTFSRTGSTAAALLVSFSRGGTAVSINTGPQDYGAIGQAVTIPAGASEATVTIVPLADNLVEGAESVELTIADDPAVARIEASDPAASEAGPDSGVFTLSRSGGDTTAALAFAVAIGGTATNNGDYGLLSGLVTIPAGELSVAIAVSPIPDNRVEGAETVILTIAPNAAYTIGAPSSATVTITDGIP